MHIFRYFARAQKEKSVKFYKKIAFRRDFSPLNDNIGNLQNYSDMGTASSESDLVSALNTKITNMSEQSTMSVRFATSASFSVFDTGRTYLGHLSKGGTSGLYGSVIFENIIGSERELIKGTKDNGTWAFSQFALKSDVPTVKCLTKNQNDGKSVTFTFSVPGTGIRVPALALSSNQFGAPVVHNLTLISGGSGYSSHSADTISNGTATIVDQPNAWGKTTIFYDSNQVIIT